VAAGRPRLAGRRDELIELVALCARAGEGSGALALVGGEAGIGKTRLAEEVAERARSSGIEVLWARCTDAAAAPSYWPWVQALRELRRRLGSQAFAAVTGGGLDDLLLAMPQVDPALAAGRVGDVGDGGTSRFLLHEAVTGTLREAAARQPTLLVLDDCHWADEPSLLLLDWLAGELSRMGLVVMATYRDHELPAGHLLHSLAARSTQDAVHVVSLHGLDAAELTDLIRAAGVPVTVDLAARVRAMTGGNPFLSLETLRVLVSGSLPWNGAVPLTHGAAAVLDRRLGTLSSDSRRMLDAAAVAGDFAVDLLEAITATPRLRLLDLVDEAVAAALVVDDHGARSFVHGLVRERVQQTMSRQRRAALHAATADALARLRGDSPNLAAELAHHHAAAIDVDGAHRGPAHDSALRAARAALDHLAYEEASRLFALAARTADISDPVGRVRCLVELGTARLRAGDVTGCLDAAEEAMGLAEAVADGAPALRAAAALVPRGVAGSGVDERILSLCERALAAQPEDPALHARLLSQRAIARADSGDPAERAQSLADGERALRMAEECDDPDALFSALNARQMALVTPADVAERLAIADRTLQLASLAHRSDIAAWGHQWRLDALFQLGDVDAAEAELQQLESLVEVRGEPLARWRVLRSRAAFAKLRGSFAEARRLTDEAHDLGLRTGNPTASYLYTFETLELALIAGGAEEFEPAARRMAEHGVARSLHAHVLATLGRIDEARATLQRDAAAGGEVDGNVPRGVWLLAMADAADAVAAVGHRELAARVLDMLMPYAGYNTCAGAGLGSSLGAMSRFTGRLAAVLERWDTAFEHLDAALALNTRMGAHPYVALTKLDIARTLVARKRPEDAARALALALECRAIAGDLGMAYASAAADALIASLERARDAGGPLSAREREVAALVAQGLGNREIAARLFLAERTVESHVKNICDKLGVNRRSQVAAWVAAREAARG